MTTTWDFTGRLNSKVIGIFTDTYWVSDPVYGEFHVLDSDETTLHNAGSTSEFRTIQFWLEDPVDDFPGLATPYRNGTTVSFTDWLGNTTDVVIRELSLIRHLKDIKRPASDYEVAQVKAKLQKA